MNFTESRSKEVREAWVRAHREIGEHNGSLRGREHLYRRFARLYGALLDSPRAARRRLQRSFRLSLAGAALMLILGGAPVAQAADINVDGTTCTLADAITAANDDTPTGGCDGGSGPDRLILTPSTTFNLTAALPRIESDVTIEGNDSTIQRDAGAANFRIFELFDNGTLGTALTLNDTTVSNGHADKGGAIYSNSGGAITLNRSTLSGNTATDRGGAIYSNETVDINDSEISGNTATNSGGGIFSYGNPDIEGSEISGNNAATAGGILAYFCTTPLVVKDSTISGNTSSAAGVASAIQATRCDVTIENSTVSGNISNGQDSHTIRVQFGELTITDSSISGNMSATSGFAVRHFRPDSSSDSLVIRRSTISDDRGGGVDASSARGSVTVESSTISGNGGDGLRLGATTAAIDNSTISGNGGSGIVANPVRTNTYYLPTATVADSTITGNGSYGIDAATYADSSSGSFQVARSIISGNQGAGPVEWKSSNDLVGSNNIIGHDSLTTAQAIGTNSLLGVNNILATSDGAPTALSSILETTLADNGGTTETHALPPGSPAVDHTPCGPATDQRGVARPQMVQCDAGSFELPPATPTPTPTATATATATPTATSTATATPTPFLADGVECNSPSECLSGSCVDDVCCNTACDTEGLSCDNPGLEGICSADAAPAPATSSTSLVLSLVTLLGLALLRLGNAPLAWARRVSRSGTEPTKRGET